MSTNAASIEAKIEPPAALFAPVEQAVDCAFTLQFLNTHCDKRNIKESTLTTAAEAALGYKYASHVTDIAPPETKTLSESPTFAEIAKQFEKLLLVTSIITADDTVGPSTMLLLLVLNA
jgi:hypothetical protein